MRKLQVYCLYLNDYFSKAGIEEFQSELEVERKIGTPFEAVSISDELLLLQSKDFNLLKVFSNRLIFKDDKPNGVLYGNAFVVRKSAEGYFSSVEESDIEFIEKTFRPIISALPDISYTYLKEDLSLEKYKV